MSVAQKSFGTTKNGEEVTLYTITNKNNAVSYTHLTLPTT